MDRTVQRGAGALFAGAGAALFVTGLLHPQGKRGTDFHSTIAGMLQDSHWPATHWLGIVAAVPAAWALWLLVDAGWTRMSQLAHAGARLMQIGLALLTVEFAVEIAAHTAADAYAAGQPVPMVALTEPLQVLAFPAFGLGAALLAFGLRAAAPRWVAWLAAVGGVVASLGAVLAEGLHVTSAGPAFIGLQLPTFWMVWAGSRLAWSTRHEPSTSAVPDPAAA